MSREDARASRAWISDSGDPVDVISGGGRVGLRRRFQVASNDIQPPLCLSPPRNPSARQGPKSIHGHGRTRHTVRTRTASSTHRPRRARTLCVHTACAMAPAARPRKLRCCPAARSLAPSGRAASSFKTLSLSLKLSLSLYIKQRNAVTGPGPTREPLSGSESLSLRESLRERERESPRPQVPGLLLLYMFITVGPMKKL